MTYRPYPIPSRIERVLKTNAHLFLTVDLEFILAALVMEEKLCNVISTFLASCSECRGGDFCHRCDKLIAMRDAALGPKLVNKNAAKKNKRAVEDVADDQDEENELEETEAA